jgi:hypothetical protein
MQQCPLDGVPSEIELATGGCHRYRLYRYRAPAVAFTSFRNYRIRSLLYAAKPNWDLLRTTHGYRSSFFTGDCAVVAGHCTLAAWDHSPAWMVRIAFERRRPSTISASQAR